MECIVSGFGGVSHAAEIKTNTNKTNPSIFFMIGVFKLMIVKP
jgi:hypothetical protein